MLSSRVKARVSCLAIFTYFSLEEIQNLPIGTNESKNENLMSNRRFRLQKEQNKKVKRLFGKQNKYQED